MFPLIFQFPLNVLCSYKAVINSTCNSGLHRIYKHSYFLFFQLKTYHWSFKISVFYKMKHVKYHAERSKYPFTLGSKFSVFSPRLKVRVLKKSWISPRLRVTCLLGKDVLNICSKFTGEHPCWSAISTELQSNFIEVALRHGCLL